jgi:hypothetical protein
VTVYPGPPRGITDTHEQRLAADLLEFANSYASRR